MFLIDNFGTNHKGFTLLKQMPDSLTNYCVRIGKIISNWWLDAIASQFERLNHPQPSILYYNRNFDYVKSNSSINTFRKIILTSCLLISLGILVFILL